MASLARRRISIRVHASRAQHAAANEGCSHPLHGGCSVGGGGTEGPRCAAVQESAAAAVSGIRIQEDAPGVRIRESAPHMRVRDSEPGYRVRDSPPSYRVRNDTPGWRVLDVVPGPGRVRPGGMPETRVHAQAQAQQNTAAQMKARAHRRTASTSTGTRQANFKARRAQQELDTATAYRNFSRRAEYYEKDKVIRLKPDREAPRLHLVPITS